MSFDQLPQDPNSFNFLQPANHRFLINRLPSTTFMVQSIKLPDVILPAISSGTPFNQLNFAGDHLEFTDLILEFKFDENLTNLREIFDWMRGLGFPEEFKQYSDLKKGNPGNAGLRSDASLIVITNGQVANKEFYFRDIFPTRIGGPKFDTRNTSVPYVTTDVHFSIRDFEINDIVP